MQKEELINLAKKWFEIMWSKPDLNLANEIVDTEYNPEWILMDKKGPELLKHEIKYFRSIFPDLNYEIVDIITEKEKIWVRYKGRGTHEGNGWGFAPTNKSVEFEGASILYITQEGKVKDLWEVYCFYDLFADLGVLPPFRDLHKYLSNYKKK